MYYVNQFVFKATKNPFFNQVQYAINILKLPKKYANT